MTCPLAVSLRIVGAIFCALVALHAHAQGTNMQQAHKAMEIARSYKGQGDLTRAEYMFGLVMKSAPSDSNIYREAKDELEYYVPLMRIQRLLWDGNLQAVEQELFELQQAFEDHPTRLQEINRILSGLRSAGTDGEAAPDEEIDEKLVMRAAESRLDAFFRQHSRFPASRSALAEALDFTVAPLTPFEIDRYSSDGTGYLLVLRRKGDRSQTITLQRTGLVQ